jgi:cytochrome c556
MRILPVACACFAIIAVTATGSVVTAKVSGPTAAQVMHERHEGMETIGKNFKAIHRELEASSPNVATVRASASTIANLSKKASGWFPAGTGPDVGKTGAKPEIWQNPKDFAAKLISFQKAAQDFSAAAAGNDPDGLKARFADFAGTCKVCHDKYRTEMHH